MMGFDNNTIRVIKTVQELLGTDTDETEVTPFSINEAINRVLIMSPAWGKDLDRVAVTDELIRRFSVWVGEDATLVDNAGHVPWLVPSRKEEWRYWQRYREWQERKLPWAAVEGLDKSTDLILGNLEDPKRDGPWDRRGLVVGHVQSGKTGNYTGLICKAADAGYKMIIVLAGLHNNLRSQTQMRLDEGFLGYETGPIVGATKLIGVGNIDSSIGVRPHYATNRTNSGDFNAAFARSLGVSPEERPWLFVVKKNKSVLTRLLKWLRDHVANSQDTESGRKLINHLPLLVIDDEADHASVDTGEKIVGEDGRPDLQHQPTAINELVRKILHTFTRSAYVGYTATPFANIFIHEKGETAEEGPDLFPSAFISNLSAPSSYVGPARVFGLSTEDGREGGLPLSRIIGDQCSEHDERQGWMPIGHRSSFQPEEVSPYGVPASLAEAINSFILSCAVRNLRGQKNEHCSMLIHVTRFNQVQKIVRQQVSSYVSHVKERFARNIDKADILSDLHALWLKDFLPTSLALNKVMDEQVEIANWVEVSSELSSVLDAIDVRMINGTAKDALDYADSPAGIKVIAIGGDKLARGLTLEGLTVSYFLRASKMYDTLMQMGRWFGYRPGYLDLCRLYTTADLVDWFGHIADASEELREEFDYMVESGSRPIDYGLKVKSHSVLMVTSRLKMRSAKPLYLSFSGQVAETVAFFREPEVLEGNLEAFQRLSSKLGSSTAIPIQQRNSRFESWSGVQWSNVKAEHIVAFLQEYETHPDSLKVNSTLLAAYIDKMSRHEELTEWTLAVMSGSSDRTYEVGGEITHLVVRTANNILPDRYSIGRLLSPKDEALDMGKDAWEAALDLTRKVWRSGESPRKAKVLPDAPSGSAIRKVRGFGADGIKAHPERGLLIIYLLDPERLDENLLDAAPPIVSFAISFPGSNSKNKVEYMVNNVHWQNWSSSMALVTESDILAIWRPLAAAGIKDGWRSIALDEFDGCRLRAACRSPGNEEALIIGFSALKLPAQNQLPQGYGFRVDKADLGEAGAGYSWLALVRQPAGSLELFSKMVTDIISTLQTSMTSKEDILFQQYLGRIRAWQNFMRRGREGLSPEEEVGLRGELELLMSLLTEGLPTFTALDSWKGPLDGLHDFELGCGSIEVKTTLSGEGFPAKIDSLEQLDDSQRYPLFLAGVRLQLAQIGTNLPQCIKDIREQLNSDPEALRCFELCMLHAGYLDSHDPLYTRVFTCAEINIHRVDDGFPRMTPFNVPSGVLSAKYEIDLGHLESERFTLDRVLDELGVF